MPLPDSLEPKKIDNDRKKKLNSFFEDQLSAPIETYQETAVKTKGVSTGFIGTKGNSAYMLKSGQLKSNNEDTGNGSKAIDKRDFMTEYITAPIYRRALYDRAPIVGLAQAYGSSEVYLKSKFIDNFQTLKSYLDTNKKEDLSIKGFEKAIAASLFMGEVDYHYENLGVVTNEEGEKNVVKIDHGRSAWEYFDNETDLIQSFNINRLNWYENISFNVEEFRDAIYEINNISQEEITNLLRKRINDLKKSGFKLNHEYYDGINLGHEIILNSRGNENQVSLNVSKDGEIVCQISNKDRIIIPKTLENEASLRRLARGEIPMFCKEAKDAIDSLLFYTSEIGYTENENDLRYKNLENYYIGGFKKHKQLFSDLGSTLDLFCKIDMSSNWKNKDWISNFYSKNNKEDLVVWAAQNDITIEGRNAISWSLDNNIKIKNMDPVTFAAYNYCKIEGRDAVIWALDNNRKINGMDPIIFATTEKYYIDNIDPIIWALDNNKQLDSIDPITFAATKGINILRNEPIIWALNNNKKINSQDPIVWAIDNKKEIEGINPLIWAINSNNKIDSKDPIAWAIDNKKEIEGINPLIWAINSNNKIDSKDPIAWAIDNKKEIEGKNVIIWAIEHDKKINEKDPLIWSLINNRQIEGLDLLSWVLKNNKIREIQKILRYAVKNDKQEIIEKLLDNKVDVNISLSQNNKTMLMIAARSGNIKIVEYLLSNGANPNLSDSFNRKSSDYSSNKELKERLLFLEKITSQEKKDTKEDQLFKDCLYIIKTNAGDPNKFKEKLLARIMKEIKGDEKAKSSIENIIEEAVDKVKSGDKSLESKVNKKNIHWLNIPSKVYDLLTNIFRKTSLMMGADKTAAELFEIAAKKSESMAKETNKLKVSSFVDREIARRGQSNINLRQER